MRPPAPHRPEAVFAAEPPCSRFCAGEKRREAHRQKPARSSPHPAFGCVGRGEAPPPLARSKRRERLGLPRTASMRAVENRHNRDPRSRLQGARTAEGDHHHGSLRSQQGSLLPLTTDGSGGPRYVDVSGGAESCFLLRGPASACSKRQRQNRTVRRHLAALPPRTASCGRPRF
jgi:hypothetical protein